MKNLLFKTTALLLLFFVFGCAKKSDPTPSIKCTVSQLKDTYTGSGGTPSIRTTTSIKYNDLGNVTEINYSDTTKDVFDYSVTNTVSYTNYNKNGSISRTTVFSIDANGYVSKEVNTYNFNFGGVTNSSVSQYLYEYDSNGYYSKSSYQSKNNNTGVFSTINIYVPTYTNGNLTSSVIYKADGTTVVSNYTYEYYTDLDYKPFPTSPNIKFGKSNKNLLKKRTIVNPAPNEGTYTYDYTYKFDTNNNMIEQTYNYKSVSFGLTFTSTSTQAFTWTCN